MDLTVCGLFEYDLVKKGIMKKGCCSSCFYNGSVFSGGDLIFICEKDGLKKMKKQKTSCNEWVIDTR